MTQSFNVQMNLLDAPQVQIGQSGSPSAKSAIAGSKDSFNSILLKALPERNDLEPQTNKEIPQAENNGVATGFNSLLNNGTHPSNNESKQSLPPTLLLPAIQNNSDLRDALLYINRALQDNPEESIVTLLSGLADKNKTDKFAETLTTDPTKQSETNKILATLLSGLADKNETDTSAETLPVDQIDQSKTHKLLATLLSGLADQNKTDTSTKAIPTDQIEQDKTNKILATLLSGVADQNKTDKSTETIPTDKIEQSETNKILATLLSGLTDKNKTDTSAETLPSDKSEVSTSQTDAKFSGDIAVFDDTSAEEPVNKNNLNNLLNVDSKNKSGGFQDTTSLTSGTKSPSDLQNATSQTSVLSGQKMHSEPPLTNSAIPPIQKAITPQQGELIDRLAPIINNGAETGVLSIKKIDTPINDYALRSQLTSSTPKVEFTHTSEEALSKTTTRGGYSFSALEEAVFAPSLRTKQENLSGIRHDSQQQWFSAKVQPQNGINDNSNPGTNQQNEGMNQQGSGFDQLSVLTNKPEPGAIFSLQGTTTTDPLTTQTPNDLKPVALPSGTLIHDQEVIKQVVERFKINHRQLDSKIQLKLHPAELGKMEIDLTVKEGSIRANVVAQSQHVQEIVERNITKLKTVLEQQGFNVEEITVTNESEMVGNFDLFDQHLSNNDGSSFLKNNENSKNNTPFVIDDFQDSDLDARTGVNVKV